MKTRKHGKRPPRSDNGLDNHKGQEQRLLGFLRSTEPAWKDEDHPELKGSADWVHKLRRGEI